MSSELASTGGEHGLRRDNVRMSDADRERVVSRLHTAVGEGRLTLGEFEDRISGVLAARTFGDIEPYVADLPSGPILPAASSHPVELSAIGSKIVRNGRWTVPARLKLCVRGSSAVLDFTEAIVAGSVVAVEVELAGSSLRLIVPEGMSVDAGGVSLIGSAVKTRHVDPYPQPGQVGAHIVVTGSIAGSTIRAMHPRTPFWERCLVALRIRRPR